jgi:hypothetical protein
MNTTTNTTAADDTIIDGVVAEVKKADPALVVLNPTQYAVELFKPFEDQLSALKRSASRVKYDITTKEGMAKAKELRAGFVKVRTTADKAKTEAKRPIDQSGKLILEHYNKLADAAKAEEAKHARAIEDEEARIEEEKQRKIAAERARIEAIEGRIAHIRNLSAQLAGADSETLAAKVEELVTQRLDPAMYDEHLDDAVNALNTAVDELRALHQRALDREAYNRQVAAERAELERLRAEQAERDRAAAEQQRQAEQAAAEQAERMRQMQAEQEKNQRIMQELQRIQQIGMREGDARALQDNLEFAKKLELDLNWFGGMASMAQMAKDMAVNSLTTKYQAALALELPLAHEEALAEDARIMAERVPMRLVEVPDPLFGRAYAFERVVEDAVTTGMGIASMSVSDSGEPAAQYVDQDDVHAQPETVIYRQPVPYNVKPSIETPPSDDDIIAVLVDHFGATRAAIATWLLDLDHAHLNSIIVESLT